MLTWQNWEKKEGMQKNFTLSIARKVWVQKQATVGIAKGPILSKLQCQSSPEVREQMVPSCEEAFAIASPHIKMQFIPCWYGCTGAGKLQRIRPQVTYRYSILLALQDLPGLL